MTAPLLRTSERKDWRRCPSCGEEDRSKFSQGQHHCKACQRVRKLFRRYGITPEQWEALYAAQGGWCGICPTRLAPLGAGTHVDHDHDTGVVRGLLCQPCNMRLGWYEEWKEEIGEYLSAASSDI